MVGGGLKIDARLAAGGRGTRGSRFRRGDGAAVRPVTVVAAAATPDTVAVFDGPAPTVDGARVGPLPVGTGYVSADATLSKRVCGRWSGLRLLPCWSFTTKC